MDVRYTKQAIKYLRKLQPKAVKSIRSKINQIAEGNTQGLNLKRFEENIYRLRVGDFRVIYEIQNNELVLIVIKIGARGDIYK